MSTNFIVTAQGPDSGLIAITGSYDGSLDYTGRILAEHYTTTEKVNELLSRGAISSIKPTLEEIDADLVDIDAAMAGSRKTRERKTKNYYSYSNLLTYNEKWIDLIYYWDGTEWFYCWIANNETKLKNMKKAFL